MIKQIFLYFISAYDDRNYILRQKAAILFAICITAFAVPLLSVVADLLYLQVLSSTSVTLLCILSLSSLVFIWILKKGWFILAANGCMICTFSAIWTMMFLGGKVSR